MNIKAHNTTGKFEINEKYLKQNYEKLMKVLIKNKNPTASIFKKEAKKYSIDLSLTVSPPKQLNRNNESILSFSDSEIN